jgi:hypothetical protein
MSRLFFTSLLFAAMSSVASAHPMPTDPDQHFSQPPAAKPGLRVDVVVDRATVRAALARRREDNLAAFRAYQRKGVFPSNLYRNEKLNVWRDEDGHLCAAATMIDQSGEHELVQRVADQNNFIRLADVTDGPVMDWMLTSGFTQREIAMIQEPFMPVGEGGPEGRVIAVKRRTQEDARLRARYSTVTDELVKDAAHSLDAATDRLMANSVLAVRLIRTSGTR